MRLIYSMSKLLTKTSITHEYDTGHNNIGQNFISKQKVLFHIEVEKKTDMQIIYRNFALQRTIYETLLVF